MANFTREAIKATFIKLLEERQFSDITVKSIVEECGINRNSFYYHFQDIPALIEEIIMDHLDRFIQKYPTIDSAETALNAAADFTMENRRAMLHIYQSANRDIYERYLWKECEYFVSAYGKTFSFTSDISEEDRRIIMHFYKCECFGLVIDWLNRRMEPDIHREISRLCELHHGMIEEMIRRAGEK